MGGCDRLLVLAHVAVNVCRLTALMFALTTGRRGRSLDVGPRVGMLSLKLSLQNSASVTRSFSPVVQRHFIFYLYTLFAGVLSCNGLAQ